ncbi:MAG: pyroglutamyl-peptidase I [Chloroflexota bacterium]
MKLLLTGFEPFGGSTINPSEQTVCALAHDGIAGVELRTAILPVDRVRGPATAIHAISDFQPDAILCLGEASRRLALSIERVAINLMDYRMADNSGHLATDEPIAPAGPAAYFVTLPVRAMLAAARAAGVPAELSLSAGAYLCNQVTYEVLHFLATNNLTTPAGFVHLPALPQQAVTSYPVMPSMGLETMTRGVRAAIGALQMEMGPR